MTFTRPAGDPLLDAWEASRPPAGTSRRCAASWSPARPAPPGFEVVERGRQHKANEYRCRVPREDPRPSSADRLPVDGRGIGPGRGSAPQGASDAGQDPDAVEALFAAVPDPGGRS